MNNPLVSVVIPTYNRVFEVERAIKSVLNQTYNNIEIIVVDDNKNINDDDTYKILKKYIESKDIYYVKNDFGQGGSSCRNKGISIAKGEFISFLDDDDVYFDTKIEEQIKYYNANNVPNVALIYCYAVGIKNNGEILNIYENDLEGNVLFEAMENCIAGTSLWLVEKSAIEKIGGFYETPSKQDTITLIRLLEAGYNIIRVPEKLVYYYEYMGNKISGTGNNAIKGREVLRDYSRSLYKNLNEKQIDILEWNFSKDLLSIYLVNKLKDKALIEYRNMKNINLNKGYVILAFIKIKLSKLYILFLKINAYRKFKNY